MEFQGFINKATSQDYVQYLLSSYSINDIICDVKYQNTPSVYYVLLYFYSVIVQITHTSVPLSVNIFDFSRENPGSHALSNRTVCCFASVYFTIN